MGAIVIEDIPDPEGRGGTQSIRKNFLASWKNWKKVRNHFQYFNVLDYGAKGDGVTDDTAAFQRAFAAVGAYGGILIIPLPTVAYLIDGESNGSLPSGSIGLETGTTFVHVIGFGSKIKQKARTTPYTMFRFRSNMIIEGIDLEGYILSGNSDATVVPQSGYGFRGKRVGGSMDNVLFRNCTSYGQSFDGWYLDDQNGGGSVVLKNCSGYNCVRNDFAAVQVKSWLIDGGTWGQDTVSYNKNSSIDCEPDVGKIVYNAEVRNITCFYRLSFAADAGTGYNAVIDNVIFDGSIKGADTGLLGANFSTLRVGGLQFINSAQTFRYNSFYYDPAGGGAQVLRGRFVIQDGLQPQIPNEIPYTCARKAGWTSTTSGSGTVTDDVDIGDRKGIKFQNPAGGYAYLSKNVAATAGVKYSFGCLLRFDSALPDERAGIWIVVNGAATTQKYLLIPTLADRVEHVCGCFTAPTGTTSVDVYIGTDDTTSISLTVSDVYFAEGIADNESVAGFSEAVNTVLPINAGNGITVAGGTSAQASVFVEADTGLVLRAKNGTTYEFAIYSANGTKTILRRPNGTEDLQFPGTGTNTFTGTVNLVSQTASLLLGTDASKNVVSVAKQASANQAAVAVQTQDALTDSTTGTADTTVADVGAVFSQATLNNNFADLVAQLAKIKADIAAMKVLQDQTRTDLIAVNIQKGSA
jgi:hypothetical protein